jgi:hypothetical protein
MEAQLKECKCQTLIRHFETERNGISIYNTFHDEAVDIVLSFLSRGQPVDNEIVPNTIVIQIHVFVYKFQCLAKIDWVYLVCGV